MAFARMKGFHHEVINIRKGVYIRKGIYHVQHVNAYHKRLKKWMERFQGVATKYLDNYLFWFRFLDGTRICLGMKPKGPFCDI